MKSILKNIQSEHYVLQAVLLIFITYFLSGWWLILYVALFAAKEYTYNYYDNKFFVPEGKKTPLVKWYDVAYFAIAALEIIFFLSLLPID